MREAGSTQKNSLHETPPLFHQCFFFHKGCEPTPFLWMLLKHYEQKWGGRCFLCFLSPLSLFSPPFSVTRNNVLSHFLRSISFQRCLCAVFLWAQALPLLCISTLLCLLCVNGETR